MNFLTEPRLRIMLEQIKAKELMAEDLPRTGGEEPQDEEIKK